MMDLVVDPVEEQPVDNAFPLAERFVHFLKSLRRNPGQSASISSVVSSQRRRSSAFVLGAGDAGEVRLDF
jgi:hypothetical protein